MSSLTIQNVEEEFQKFVSKTWEKVENNSRFFLWNFFRLVMNFCPDINVRVKAGLKMKQLYNQTLWEKEAFVFFVTLKLDKKFFIACLEICQKTEKNFEQLTFNSTKEEIIQDMALLSTPIKPTLTLSPDATAPSLANIESNESLSSVPFDAAAIIEQSLNKDLSLSGPIFYRDKCGTPYSGNIALKPHSLIMRSYLEHTQNVGQPNTCIAIRSYHVSHEEAITFLNQVYNESKTVEMRAKELKAPKLKSRFWNSYGHQQTKNGPMDTFLTKSKKGI